MFAGEQDQRHREPRRAARRAAQPVEPADRGRRPRRHARRERRARSHARLQRAVCAAARWTGYTGQRITDVVNIGIGGSDLGPAMATMALTPYAREGPRHALRVERRRRRTWPRPFAALEPGDDALHHRVEDVHDRRDDDERALGARVVSRRGEGRGARRQALRGGVDQRDAKSARSASTPTNMFVFWDWVGGRYSLWSSIGLPIAIAIGFDALRASCSTARTQMDEHFRTAPIDDNLPFTLGLLGVWYVELPRRARRYAVLPYDQYLLRLPAYLQQLDMESNGKRVDREGRVGRLRRPGPIVWGEPGHQRAARVLSADSPGHAADPVRLPDRRATRTIRSAGITPRCWPTASRRAKRWPLARPKTRRARELVAQGLDESAIARLLPHKVFPGNRPSTTIVYRQLDPRTLGKLIALYEHKVFVMGAIWNINSFDQWGVELGKQLAKRSAGAGGPGADRDARLVDQRPDGFRQTSPPEAASLADAAVE